MARPPQSSPRSPDSSEGAHPGKKARRTGRRRTVEHSDVRVSAVISTYLLTHLHHVLQRAEYRAQQEGRSALAANYAQLRKVLCLDARSVDDGAPASGSEDDGLDQAA